MIDSTMIACPECLGHKEVNSIGGVKRTCPKCLGVGIVSQKEVVERCPHCGLLPTDDLNPIIKELPGILIGGVEIDGMGIDISHEEMLDLHETFSSEAEAMGKYSESKDLEIGDTVTFEKPVVRKKPGPKPRVK